MSSAVQDVVRGAAVVIDDRIKQESAGIDGIISQLESANVPTVLLDALPPTESLVHWKQLALIVMDWRLTGPSDDSGIELPAGVTVPSALAEDGVSSNVEFLSVLLQQTALPVFIATNDEVGSVGQTLQERLSGPFPKFAERVHVFSKTDLQPDLFAKVGDWIRSRPALHVLEAWRRAYVEAEIAVFQEFSSAEEDWVASIQRAAVKHSEPLDLLLRELIASNVFNRIPPLTVDLTDPSEEELSDASALRKVLHMSAVIPEEALTGPEPYTGDLFVAVDASEPFAEIRILLTPECELMGRNGSEWRYTYVIAKRRTPLIENPDSKKPAKSEARLKKVRAPEREHLASNLLTATGDEYKIALKSWRSEFVERAAETDGLPPPTWEGFRRIGRLIDPFVTHMQQNFAIYAIRKGLPTLPGDFYHGWAEPDLDEHDESSGPMHRTDPA